MAQQQTPEPTAERPGMPSGYGIAQGHDWTPMAWSTVNEQLATAHNYWICTTRPDGRPHAMPVWGIWLDGAVYFSTDRASRKARNLAANPALTVHLESGDEAVILEGKAEEANDSALLARYVDAYDAKYSFRPDPQAPGQVTYALRLRSVLAWLERDFTNTATRWRFGAASA